MSKPKEAIYDLSDVVIDTRYQKILSEAINRGCLRDAITAVGLLHVERSLLNHKECVRMRKNYIHFSSRAGRSDLLAEIDIYESIFNHKFKNLKEEGIDGRVYSKVKKFVSDLRQKLKKKGFDIDARTDDDERLIICIFKGMEDMLMKDHSMSSSYNNEQYTDLYVSYLFNSSNVFASEWCIGIPQSFITAKGRKKRLCLFKTPISLATILRYGDRDKLHRENTFYSFNIETHVIDVISQLFYDSIMLNYRHVSYYPDDEDYDKMCETYREQIQHKIQDKENREHMLKNEYMITSKSSVSTPKQDEPVEVPKLIPNQNPDMVEALKKGGFSV